jgi:hypothetical protein
MQTLLKACNFITNLLDVRRGFAEGNSVDKAVDLGLSCSLVYQCLFNFIVENLSDKFIF